MTTPQRQIEAKPAPGSGPIDYRRLRGLLDEQESLFVRLDALSKRQSVLVRDQATDDLLRVLGERHAVVDALDLAARELEPYRARWGEVLRGARPEQHERFSAQVNRLADLAATIAARDDADRGLIEARRDRLADELAGVGNVRGAVAAYAPARGRPAARFQDREG